MTRELKLPDRPLLLDGGMGRELQKRGIALSRTIWSASSLISAPDTVRQIHEDYIKAGADIITTNSYGLIKGDLSRAGIADRFAELNQLAGRLAKEAQEKADQKVLIAGSLPPLRGSFRPDRVGPRHEILPCYKAQAALLAPFVDLFLCETMSSCDEARAAAEGALATGRPVWVSWTLHETLAGCLRSTEPIPQAMDALKDLSISGFLVNCCAPAAVTKAIPLMVNNTDQRVGGYANTFHPIPADWRLDGEKSSDGLLQLRKDLGPDAYAVHARQWIDAGADIIGGCCGTGPLHISKLAGLIN